MKGIKQSGVKYDKKNVFCAIKKQQNIVGRPREIRRLFLRVLRKKITGHFSTGIFPGLKY